MDPAAVMPAWHSLLHPLTAAVFLLTGLPILFLSMRAWSRRPRRPLRRPTGPRRATVYAVVTAMASGIAIVLLMTAARSAALSEAVLASTGTALAGAIALHSVRRASFAGVSTVPLVGLLGIATLLAVAGPQPEAMHTHSSDAASPGSAAPHAHNAPSP
ncbi:MAG: hypothetical protein M3R54_12620 [Chloroflexota bacterium]|nr:hypothetical protein [Chloroflexota bacterium]